MYVLFIYLLFIYNQSKKHIYNITVRTNTPIQYGIYCQNVYNYIHLHKYIHAYIYIYKHMYVTDFLVILYVICKNINMCVHLYGVF